MKQIVATILLISASLALLGQGMPDWVDTDFRKMKFPENVYFTGFAYGEATAGRTLQDVTQQLITDAQADLSRKIRVQITSRTQSEMLAVSAGGQYRESESFQNRAATESDAEVTGIKTESYYDAKTRIVYAFAYVNRFELSGYHKASLTMNITQMEGLLQTALDLQTSGEKSKARQQCEAAKLLLEKVRASQNLLMAIDPNATPDAQQQQKIETFHNQIAQMTSQLAQAVYVYIESEESNFSRPTTILANRLKSALAAKGCSFIDDAGQADFRMKITATTRHHGIEQGFTVCFADIAVSLFDAHKNRSVYEDEFSQKGISTNQETAGRKALEDAAPIIVNKISQWLE